MTSAHPAAGFATAGARHVELHVRLPDRPGALGAVASRIGALGADITDVHIASRDHRTAEDVFHLDLPPTDVDLVALLHDEIHEVDGAHVALIAVRSDGCCRTAADDRAS
ncbi:MAG TPA: ACT domain-containing protein [Acidimicrobiales bacterium]|nr:ACT domain-containing protein [Acidimicrobiales bacterium]